MCVDLHTHSYYSDGTASPAELVGMASEIGLHALALTDHDTLDGVAEAMEHGRRSNVQVIPGLEISTVFRKRSLHILGYGVDHEDQELRQWLERLHSSREERNRKIIVNLQQLGLEISAEEVEEISSCGQTGRPHIAALLVRKNLVGSMEEAFDRYLGWGRPAWCRRFAYSTGEAIDMIHRAGGVAVLAHPGLAAPNKNDLHRLVRELVTQGLDGLEAYYPEHTGRMQKAVLRIAGNHGLVVTGGSDYHGGNRPGNFLAGIRGSICPPNEIVDNLLKKLERMEQALP